MFHRVLAASLRLAAATCVTIAFAAGAAAGPITFISTKGNNANPCTLKKPCRSLQHGIDQTPNGGRLEILDSGNYGPKGAIKKSITIAGNGHTVLIGRPVTINKANATVRLRGLVLDGKGATNHGIRILRATAVHIERCVVFNFATDGIRLEGASAQLFVLDSVSHDNGQIGLSAVSTDATVTVDNSRFENNGNIGIYAESTESTITRTVVSGNGGNGVHAEGGRMNVTSTTSAQNFHGFVVANAGDMVVESSVARGNTSIGLFASNGTATISNSVFTHNNTGINNSATVLTRENNTVVLNTSNVQGPLTPLGGT